MHPKTNSKSIELKEPDTLNLNFLAEIFLATNDYKEAIKVLNKILEKDKNNAISIFKLAKIYLEIGELEKAEKYFNEAVKCDPTNFEIQFVSCFFLLTSTNYIHR